jgi:shikimate dehydrogenase
MAADLGLQVEQVSLEHWAERGGLVVSTLPAAAGAAAAAVLDGHRLEGTLLDVVYAGWPTPLARAAEAAGLTVVSGLDMLVHQAAEQVRLMTGHEAPLQAMLAAGRQAVSR